MHLLMFRFHIILGLLFCYTALNAQNYYFIKRSGGNPIHAITGEVLNTESDNGDETSGNWKRVMDSALTPEFSNTVYLPFNFKFNGSNVVACKIASTGYLTFDTTVTGKPLQGTVLLPSSGIPDRSVYIGGINLAGSNDKVLTGVFGNTPNRQFWIKYHSASTAGDSTGSYNYFSIVLEENSNRIYVVSMHQGSPFDAFVAPKVNFGIQINSSTAVTVDNSNVNSWNKSGGNHYSDNDYFEFNFGNQLSYDIETRIIPIKGTVLQSQNATIEFELYNSGSQNIDSTMVYYSINGGTAVGKKYYTTADLKPSRITKFTDNFQIQALNPAGTVYEILVWIEKANETVEINKTNDTGRIRFIVATGASANPKILLESATASWCGDCPIANLKLGEIVKKYGDTVILVQHHILDNMAGNGTQLTNELINTIPEVLLNRLEFDNNKGIDIDSVQNKISLIKAAYSPVDVEIFDLNLNETTRNFTFRVKATFKDYYIGNINVGGIAVEDKVRGFGTGFNQEVDLKYTSSKTNWFYNFSNPIVGYYHDAVAWNFPLGIWGAEASAGSAVYKPGDTISKLCSYQYPALLKSVVISKSPYLPIGTVFSYGKPMDMSAIAFVSTNQNGTNYILNSSKRNLWDTTLNSQKISGISNTKIFPNPSSGVINITTGQGVFDFELYAASGIKITGFSENFASQEALVLDLSKYRLSNGLYYLNVRDEQGKSMSFRVILNQ